jgi:replicative DNA helicase
MAIPHDIESEQAVLASLALKPALADDVVARLGPEPECFFDRKHQAIYPALLNLAARNETPDQVTVGAELQRLGLLKAFKGRADFEDYFLYMCEQVPTLANYDSYVRVVKNRHLARQLQAINNESAENATLPDRTIQDLLLELQRSGNRLLAQADESLTERFGDVAEAVLEDAVDRTEAANNLEEGQHLGLPTGIPGLTELIGGLRPGQFVLIGASTSGGKSTVMMQIAQAIATTAPSRAAGADPKSHGGVLVVSLEMTARELVAKILFGEARVDSRHVDAGSLTEDELAEVDQALARLRNLRIFIAFVPGATWPRVRARILLERDKHGIECAFIDYIQKISKPQRVEKKDHVAELASECKTLAGQLGITLICLAQLRRRGKKSNGKEARPTKEDFGESSYLEKDSDLAILLHHKGAPVEAQAPENHKLTGAAKPHDVVLVDVIVDKHRTGSTGTVSTLFNKTLGRFLPPPDPKDQFLGRTIEPERTDRSDRKDAF